MRYRLRTLLIVLALGPVVIAALYWASQMKTVQPPPRNDSEYWQEAERWLERDGKRELDGYVDSPNP